VEEDTWRADNLQDDTEELIVCLTSSQSTSPSTEKEPGPQPSTYGGSGKSVRSLTGRYGGIITIYFIFCVYDHYNAHVILIPRQGVLIEI
jgi:hypothetical protein